jgi:hypothetical protein
MNGLPKCSFGANLVVEIKVSKSRVAMRICIIWHAKNSKSGRPEFHFRRVQQSRAKVQTVHCHPCIARVAVRRNVMSRVRK